MTRSPPTRMRKSSREISSTTSRPPAFRRAEVEEGVAKREVEDVAAGFFEFVADGRRFGHFYNLVQELTRIRQSGSFCRVL